MKTKVLKALLCLLVITSLCFASCDRVKEAVGVDKIVEGNLAVLPDDDANGNNQEDGVGTLISEGSEIIELERPEEKPFQLGEPILKEYTINQNYREDDSAELIKEIGTVLVEYTVTNLQILTNISDEIKENLTAYTYYDEEKKEKVYYDLDDYIDADGNLDSDYLFVMVDIGMKYVSGTYEKTPRDVKVGTLEADNPIVSEGNERVYEYESFGKKYTLTYYDDLDKNGDPHVPVEEFAYYYEFLTETVSWSYTDKGERYISLAVGEENWKRVGVLYKKSDIEKWGIIVNFYDGYQVPLDIDLSEYE